MRTMGGLQDIEAVETFRMAWPPALQLAVTMAHNGAVLPATLPCLDLGLHLISGV